MEITEEKHMVKGMILFLLVMTLLGCGGHFVKERILIPYHYNRDKVLIETYLKDYFEKEPINAKSGRLCNKAMGIIMQVYWHWTPMS